MPLTNKQKKIVTDGCSACKEWEDHCLRLRALGFPDEAMEERCKAAKQTLQAAQQIVSEYESTKQG